MALDLLVDIATVVMGAAAIAGTVIAFYGLHLGRQARREHRAQVQADALTAKGDALLGSVREYLAAALPFWDLKVRPAENSAELVKLHEALEKIRAIPLEIKVRAEAIEHDSVTPHAKRCVELAEQITHCAMFLYIPLVHHSEDKRTNLAYSKAALRDTLNGHKPHLHLIDELWDKVGGEATTNNASYASGWFEVTAEEFVRSLAVCEQAIFDAA